MKAQLMSDLHTCFYLDPLAFLGSLQYEPGLDFLFLPGDIVLPCRQSEETVREILGFLSGKARHVLYLTGNHEYYHGSLAMAHCTLMKAMPSNFHWLNNNDETIEGVHFFGGTLWFLYDEMNHWYERQLNDFNLIRGFRDWVYKENGAFASRPAN